MEDDGKTTPPQQKDVPLIEKRSIATDAISHLADTATIATALKVAYDSRKPRK